MWSCELGKIKSSSVIFGAWRFHLNTELGVFCCFQVCSRIKLVWLYCSSILSSVGFQYLSNFCLG